MKSRRRRFWRGMFWLSSLITGSVFAGSVVSLFCNCRAEFAYLNSVEVSSGIIWVTHTSGSGWSGWVCRPVITFSPHDGPALGAACGWPRLTIDPTLVDLLELPLWMLIGASALFAALSRWMSKRRYPSGFCARCGYNLTGNVSGRCPECGAEVRAGEGAGA